MNDPKTTPAEPPPGHYGPGYGEQTSSKAPESTSAADASTLPSDDGSPVVFTPEDVTLRPPDHPPTEAAPESEKASLIFERS